MSSSFSIQAEKPQHFHLFGYPIAHSAAPAFHNECFVNLSGRPRHFTCWSTSAVTMDMLEEIRSENVGGAAVTMPLKTTILAYLDELTPTAEATQACNTIVKVRHGMSEILVGTNTDVFGVRNALLRELQAQHPTQGTPSPQQRFPAGAASAVVIGGGATTRSAIHALQKLGLAPIYLVNRDASEVALVIDSFKKTELILIHLQSMEDVERHLNCGVEEERLKAALAVVVGAIPAIAPASAAELLVYAIAERVFNVPQPRPTEPSLSYASDAALPLPQTRIFLDMAYKPRLTPLLRMAAACGWATVGGVQAMIEQGLAQQRMWLVGSVDDSVACAGPVLLGEEVEVRARRLVENMEDVEVSGEELDRARF